MDNEHYWIMDTIGQWTLLDNRHYWTRWTHLDNGQIIEQMIDDKKKIALLKTRIFTLNPGLGTFALLKASKCKVVESTVELDNFVGRGGAGVYCRLVIKLVLPHFGQVND